MSTGASLRRAADRVRGRSGYGNEWAGVVTPVLARRLPLVLRFGVHAAVVLAHAPRRTGPLVLGPRPPDNEHDDNGADCCGNLDENHGGNLPDPEGSRSRRRGQLVVLLAPIHERCDEHDEHENDRHPNGFKHIHPCVYGGGTEVNLPSRTRPCGKSSGRPGDCFPALSGYGTGTNEAPPKGLTIMRQ
jgi:hypothetical protein